MAGGRFWLLVGDESSEEEVIGDKSSSDFGNLSTPSKYPISPPRICDGFNACGLGSLRKQCRQVRGFFCSCSISSVSAITCNIENKSIHVSGQIDNSSSPNLGAIRNYGLTLEQHRVVSSKIVMHKLQLEPCPGIPPIDLDSVGMVEIPNS